MNKNKKPRRPTTVRIPEKCPYCSNTDLKRRGKRKRRHGSIQLFYCRPCNKRFTGQTLKGRQFPSSVILEGLSLYHLGYTPAEAARRLEYEFGSPVTNDTIARWAKEFEKFCPFGRLREEALRLYKPEKMIETIRMRHQQNYDFKLHKAKLDILLRDPQHKKFQPLKELLESVAHDCPHELFRQQSRASKANNLFSRDELWIERKNNFAVDVAKLVIQSVNKNTLRHQAIQDFMLATDSVTIAAEVPIVLDKIDFDDLRWLGFDIPQSLDHTVTGHIDLVQIRNGGIHILDYKPDAQNVDAVDQLTIYALALSRLTGLRLFEFSCGWFDETGYFDFWPLHAVYKPRKRRGRENVEPRREEGPRKTRRRRKRGSGGWDGWGWCA